MITDFELEEMARSCGCSVNYIGGDVWECFSPCDNWCGEHCWYGDYSQIYQLLEDLRLEHKGLMHSSPIDSGRGSAQSQYSDCRSLDALQPAKPV